VSQRMLEWQGWAAAVALPVALVVLVAVPALMVSSHPNADRADLIAGALTYSVPFAAALAVSAFIGRPEALLVAGAVAGSAFIAVAGKPFLDLRLPFDDARGLAIGAAAVVVASRLVPRTRPAAAVW
jgi:putative effector of murein hydrolase